MMRHTDPMRAETSTPAFGRVPDEGGANGLAGGMAAEQRRLQSELDLRNCALNLRPATL